MKIKIERNVVHLGTLHKKGDIIEVDSEKGDQLLDGGHATKAGETIVKPEKPEKPEK